MDAYKAAAAEAGLRLTEFSCKSDAKRHALWKKALALMWADPNLIVCTRDPCIWTTFTTCEDPELADMLLQDTNLPALARGRFAYMEQDENDVLTCLHKAHLRCMVLSEPIENFKRWLGCESLRGKTMECVICLCELGVGRQLCNRCAKGLCKEDYQRLEAYAKAAGEGLKCPHCREVWAEA
jgi:hypothetical protein